MRIHLLVCHILSDSAKTSEGVVRGIKIFHFKFFKTFGKADCMRVIGPRDFGKNQYWKY